MNSSDEIFALRNFGTCQSSVKSWLQSKIEYFKVLDSSMLQIPSVRTTRKAKSASRTLKISASLASKTSRQRHETTSLLNTEETRFRVIRLVKQKQELDLNRRLQEQEWLQQGLLQEREQLQKEHALRLGELERKNKKRLADATLTKFELDYDLSETSHYCLILVRRIKAKWKNGDAGKVCQQRLI